MKYDDLAVEDSTISREYEMSEPTASKQLAGYERATGMLPIAAILLPLMAYTNLWITDLVPGYGWFEQTLPRVLLILLTIGYLMIIWITGPTPRAAILQRARLWRSTIGLGVIVLIVLVPTAMFIRDRLIRGPYPENVIDWPLQIEAGSDLLLSGRSPYAADYSATEMRLWSERANFHNNPAMHHAIHLPMNFVLSALIKPLWQALIGWYDARIILLAAYFAVLLIAPRLARSWEEGHALQIGLALNPLLIDTFVVGLSDYLLLAFLVVILWLRQRGWLRAAACLLGLAVATRQFSWLLVPIYVAAEWFALPQQTSRARVRELVRRVWLLPTIAILVIAPFLLANPRGFYNDVIAYGSGGVADAFPIGGPGSFGVSVIVLAMGWAKDRSAQFPFLLLQLAATLPLIGYAVWRQRRQNTLRGMLLSYVIVLAVFLFMGRFMNTNYVGFLFALLILTAFISETPLVPVGVPNEIK
jgi:hypothetical protein